MVSQSELHNKLAGEIVRSIVEPPLEAGGSVSDTLVLLESVVLGVMLFAEAKNGYKEHALDALVTGVKRRWRTIRLTRNGLSPREDWSSSPTDGT